MAILKKTNMSAPMGLMDKGKKKKKEPTRKDIDPKTRKSLFGGKEITRSRSTDKKGRVVRTKFVQNPDGSSKAKITAKKPGLKNIFKAKLKTTINTGTNPNDVVTKRVSRQKGVLPRKIKYTDLQAEDKSYRKTNLLYKLNSKSGRQKMDSDIRSAAEKFTPENCLEGCTRGISK